MESSWDLEPPPIVKAATTQGLGTGVDRQKTREMQTAGKPRDGKNKPGMGPRETRGAKHP